MAGKGERLWAAVGEAVRAVVGEPAEAWLMKAACPAEVAIPVLRTLPQPVHSAQRGCGAPPAPRPPAVPVVPHTASVQWQHSYSEQAARLQPRPPPLVTDEVLGPAAREFARP